MGIYANKHAKHVSIGTYQARQTCSARKHVGTPSTQACRAIKAREHISTPSMRFSRLIYVYSKEKKIFRI